MFEKKCENYELFQIKIIHQREEKKLIHCVVFIFILLGRVEIFCRFSVFSFFVRLSVCFIVSNVSICEDFSIVLFCFVLFFLFFFSSFSARVSIFQLNNIFISFFCFFFFVRLSFFLFYPFKCDYMCRM